MNVEVVGQADLPVLVLASSGMRHAESYVDVRCGAEATNTGQSKVASIVVGRSKQINDGNLFHVFFSPQRECAPPRDLRDFRSGRTL